ncbi:MAG: DNA-binding protein [Candidatus Bathyarchaeia archaeon]
MSCSTTINDARRMTMEYFSTDKLGRVFIVRLDPGDYVLESMSELVVREKIKDAVVISAVGTLDMCTLHMVTTTGYPPKEYFKRWENEPLELVSFRACFNRRYYS